MRPNGVAVSWRVEWNSAAFIVSLLAGTRADTYCLYVTTHRMPLKSRQLEKSAATRAALIKIARKLLGDRGYANTGTEELVRRARVARGDLYHHFKDKRDLFKAVLLDEEKRLAAATTAVAARQSDPWKALSAGCNAFLNECLDPAVQRIVLIEAPAVLGWEAYRQIDADYFLAGINSAIEAAAQTGPIS